MSSVLRNPTRSFNFSLKGQGLFFSFFLTSEGEQLVQNNTQHIQDPLSPCILGISGPSFHNRALIKSQLNSTGLASN